jgi:hypothetical protein
MEPICLLRRLAAIGPGRSGLGFLGPSRFRRKKPLFMRVGFPWILSSESRLFNWLQAKSARKYFSRCFPLAERSVGARARCLADAEGGTGHGESVPWFLVFRKRLSPRHSPSAIEPWPGATPWTLRRAGLTARARAGISAGAHGGPPASGCWISRLGGSVPPRDRVDAACARSWKGPSCPARI